MSRAAVTALLTLHASGYLAAQAGPGASAATWSETRGAVIRRGLEEAAREVGRGLDVEQLVEAIGAVLQVGGVGAL